MLEQRALFRTPAGAVYRLLGISTQRAKPVAHIFGMEDPKALPRALALDELKEGLKSGEFKSIERKLPFLVKSAAQPRNMAPDEDSPAQALFKWRRELIAPLAADERIYERKHRGRLVAERAKEMNASEQTIMACLRLYWRGGMTFDALMPEFHKCGTPTNGKAGSPPQSGRPAKRYKIFRWSDDLKAKVLKTLRAVLRKTPKASHPLLYRRALTKHFATTTLVDRNGKQQAVIKQLPLGERPSRAQVYYLINEAFSLEERLRHKHGDDGFENNVDVKTGSAREYAAFAGNFYEIDSTIVDCWIVDDDDANTVIGKATLYIVIDVFTRLMVGFHLTLDSPSWAGAMEAILSLVEDKQKLCDRWGFEYRAEDWPAHGVVPAFFRTDRGSEFTSYAREVLTDQLGINYVNAPARKSPTRGTVECGHKLISVPIKENVGGYTPPEEFGKRQVDDHRDGAYRTLKSLGEELLRGMRLNNHKVHRRVELKAAKVWAKEQPIPIRMWALSTAGSVGLHTTREEEFMRFKLLPTVENLSVTPRGVFIEGLLYVPEKPLQRQWLLPATKGFYKVDATFDRRSVATLYVHDKKDPTKWTTMHLSPSQAHYHGRSWAQFEALKLVKVTLDQLAEEHNLALELQNDHEAAQREHQSRASAQKAIRAVKSTSRKANSVEKRAAATDKEHTAVPVLPTTALPQPPTPPRVAPVTPATPIPQPPAASVVERQPKLAPTAANSALQALLKLKAKA